MKYNNIEYKIERKNMPSLVLKVHLQETLEQASSVNNLV